MNRVSRSVSFVQAWHTLDPANDSRLGCERGRRAGAVGYDRSEWLQRRRRRPCAPALRSCVCSYPSGLAVGPDCVFALGALVSIWCLFLEGTSKTLEN